MDNIVSDWKYIAKALRKVDPDPVTGITSLTHEAARRGDNLAIELDRLRAINAELVAALQELLPLAAQMNSATGVWNKQLDKARAALSKAGA